MKARDKFQELNLSNAFLFAAVMNDAEVCRLVLEILTGEPVEAVNVQSDRVFYSVPISGACVLMFMPGTAWR